MARGDRIRANASIVRAQMFGCCCCIGCQSRQYLDVRVRDGNGLPVQQANIVVRDTANLAGPPTAQVFTDHVGDVIIPVPAATYNVEAQKEWFVPEPAAQNGVVVPANSMQRVDLVLDELRYYLHVDADRDGDVDNQHEGLNVLVPWAWGANSRGAVILCNNDYDDGVALPPARTPDNEDNNVNLNQDTNEIAPLEIRRVGPATAPSIACNWQATLSIRGGREDKIRIFNGIPANSARALGADVGGAAPLDHVTLPLRIAGPASQPTLLYGMEATDYASTGFDGLIELRLSVSKNQYGGGAVLQYYTAAHVRVAPWMMPSHNDHAHRIYVSDVGPDVPAAGALGVAGVLDAGNGTFRADLGNIINARGVAYTQYRQNPAHPETDIWMQDCMEIGYSVLPKNTGASTRHRIEAVMQAHRDDRGVLDLRDCPRLLLDADFGFSYPGVSSAQAGIAAAVVGGAASTAYTAAENAAWTELDAWVVAGLLVGPLAAVPARANAADAAALAVTNQMAINGWTKPGRDLMIANAIGQLTALGYPLGIADAVATVAASQAMEDASTGTTFDSFGNLECTPPCRAGAGAVVVGGVAAGPKEYPWGRIYYGDGLGTFDAPTRDFLRAQRVQLPMAINTNWLVVGHVDEMMSFIPVPNGPPWKQWKLLLASPSRAYALLGAQPAITPVLVGRHLEYEPPSVPAKAWRPVHTTAGAMMGHGASPIPLPAGGGNLTWQQIRNFNLNVLQPQINAIRNQLVHEIGLTVPVDVIEVPVVFVPDNAAMTKASALTADMVNMVVMNNDLIIPKPFGPVTAGVDAFETYLRTEIFQANPALVTHFVDDWYPYHARLGEIHCGTNTHRKPVNLANWLASESAEWWRFNG